MSDFQREVGEWGLETFPNSTVETILAHLKDEVDELLSAAGWDGSEMAMDHEVFEEAADVYLLLLNFAHRCGFSLETAARQKMDMNRTRTWTTDSGRGYVKHTEEAK